MGATYSRVITCPVCNAHGAMLHHDVRASLLYACQACMHEWQIDPADELPQVDPTAAERTRAASEWSTPPRKR